MIVDSMTDLEVYHELARDREGVTTWWEHQLEAQRRRALKTRKFPLLLWFDYTSPRRVRYLFNTRIYDRKMRQILTGIIALRRMPDGFAAYTTWTGKQQCIRPMVLTPHMLKRYAERCHIEKTGIDLIRHFFEHNYQGIDSRNNLAMGKSVRWNGESHQSCSVVDGVMLGQMNGAIYVVRTFVTYDMCGGTQREEFEGKRDQLLNDDAYCQKLDIYYRIKDYLP